SPAVVSLADSSNWSGYEVTGATFTDVEGSWNTQCGAADEGSDVRLATWLGIGGDPGALLQVGTIWTNGTYHLVSEFVPPGGGGGATIRPTAFPCGTPISAKVYKALDG